MKMRFERPLALALAGSLVIHLLLVAAWMRWYEPGRSIPATRATVIAVALQMAGVTAVGESAGAPIAGPEPTGAQPEIVGETARPTPRASGEDAASIAPAAEAPVNLNPAPLLESDYRILPATLAVRAPMSGRQRDALQAAVNHFAATLPEWTDPGQPLRWRDGEREFHIAVSQREPASATGLERLVLEVQTDWDGLSLAARVPVKRMAFSHFAQVVNRWDPDVSLAGDRVIGRFHSNSAVWVDADRDSEPLVTGPASVAGRVNIKGSARRAQIFARGVQTRAARLEMPGQLVLPDPAVAGEQNIHVIDTDARVEFIGVKGYRWQSLEAPAGVKTVKPASFPWLIIAENGRTLQVEGTVSGSVLVYAQRGISVTGSLTYAQDPRADVNSPDFLGLVSERNIEVAPPEVTGPGDIDVFASLYAGRQFRVRRYRATDGGKLSIYGSLTAGSLSATEPRFTTRLEFDPRLENQRPAYFPLTGRYVVDGPAPDWRVEVATARR